jgi:hypothetical protein
MVFLALALGAEVLQQHKVYIHTCLTDNQLIQPNRRTQAAMMSPSSFLLSLFTIVSLALLSSAQTGPQAAMIPACVVRSCSND